MMPELTASEQKAAADAGIDPGTLYRVAAGWPKGTRLSFTDAGVFVTVPGVPGSYLLADARRAL